MSILFINACVRENSRTLKLAESILSNMKGEITEVNLNKEILSPLNRELLEKREACFAAKAWMTLCFFMPINLRKPMRSL